MAGFSVSTISHQGEGIGRIALTPVVVLDFELGSQGICLPFSSIRGIGVGVWSVPPGGWSTPLGNIGPVMIGPEESHAQFAPE